MTISYDKHADVLYVTFSRPVGRAEYVEIEDAILRIDESSQKVVGITIPFFMEKIDSGRRLDFPEIGGIPFCEQTLATLREAMGAEDSAA